jgi:hypothetical protein
MFTVGTVLMVGTSRIYGRYVGTCTGIKIPVVTETIVTVLKFEHRERAKILVRKALF